MEGIAHVGADLRLVVLIHVQDVLAEGPVEHVLPFVDRNGRQGRLDVGIAGVQRDEVDCPSRLVSTVRSGRLGHQAGCAAALDPVAVRFARTRS